MTTRSKRAIRAIIYRFVGPIPQVFMVKSRVSSAYREFVFGRYTIRGTLSPLELLNNMVVNEKILLLSLDFPRIWYHIWLTVPTPSSPGKIYQFYTACRVRFERFVRDDGRSLTGLVRQSRSAGDTVWAFPGGRPDGEERDLDCVFREIQEEAGIGRDNVRLVDTEPLESTRVSGDVRYDTRYYIMTSIGDIAEGVSFSNPDQFREIADARWMRIPELPPECRRLAEIGAIAARR